MLRGTKPPFFVALALAMTAFLVTATSAAAATVWDESNDYGSAVKCKYAVTEYVDGSWNEARLRNITGIPPVMFAHQGQEMLGWRFVVARSIDHGPYSMTYKSPIQKRMGTTTQEARFGVMKVRVALPTVARPDLVRYRVTLVMFHYSLNGALLSKISYLMPRYLTTFDGLRGDLGLDHCPGTVSAT